MPSLTSTTRATQSAQRATPAQPGRLSILTLSLAAALSALAAPQAWALDTPSSQNGYTWDSINTDPDVSISSGITIGGSNVVTALQSGSSGLGTLTNQGVIRSSTTGLLLNSGNSATLVNNGSFGSIIGNVVINGVLNTLTNDGLIDGQYGVLIAGTIGTLNNSGNISGTGIGINNGSGGSISTLLNSQLISGSSIGLQNTGDIATLDNSGTIYGTLYGIRNGTASTPSGTIATLTNTGVISAGTIGGLSTTDQIGIYNNAVIGKLVNGGTINGVYGILNSGTVNALNNTGTLNGVMAGFVNGALTSNSTTASIQTLNNAGVISGAYAAMLNLGQIATLNNSGTIFGGNGLLNSGHIGTLNNSGLISASLVALNLSAPSVIDSFINSGTIAGTILNLATAPLSISGGSGNTFGTLTGVNGSIGTIYSASEVRFSGGNQLLNDNIIMGAYYNNTYSVVATGIGTVTNAGGILQVNNHISITGDYRQNTAATLAIGVSDAAVTNGVSADTGYGRLIVTGNATIDSGSGVTLKKLNTYSFATGQRFVVIQAATATYNASTLVYTVDGYSASGTTVVDGSNQDLVVTIGAAAGSTSTTPTNGATDSSSTGVFKGLFNYTGLNQSLIDVFNPALALKDPNEANQAGQRLSPTATRGAAGSGAQAAANAVGGTANDRIDTQRGGGGGDSGVATGETTLSPALWGRAFGGRANQGERDGIAGFHANYGGVLIGGDALVNPDWRVGGLFSYAHTNAGNDGSNSGSSANINAYGLMAYAGFDGKPWYLNLTVGVSRQNYSTTRDISFTGFSGIANGSYNGSVTTASAQAGYPLDIGATTVTPLAGLNYSSLRQNGYTESGSGAALTVNGSTSNSIKSLIGVKAEQSFLTSYGMLKPSVQLGWNHEFRDTRQTTSASFAADTTGATAFTTLGVTPLKDTAQLSFAATLLQSKNLTLSARYTVEAASGYTAQTGDLTLRWQY